MSGEVRLHSESVSVSLAHNKGVQKGEDHFSLAGGQWPR